MKVWRERLSIVGLSCIAALPTSGFAQDWDTLETGDYRVRNITNGNTIPLTIEDNAIADSLYISSVGNVGLGDAPPTGTFSPRLYVSDPTPEIELDDIDDNQIWQIFADGGDVSQGGSDTLGGIGFFDSTASTVPLFVESEAPSASLYINTDGFLGSGTIEPLVNLHLVGDSTDPVEELFRLESSTSPQQVFINDTTGAKWFFAMTSNDTFKVSFDGTGKVEARFLQNGNLNIAGRLSQNSDRNNKQNVNEIDSIEVLQRLASLPITTWEYKSEEGVTHMGPMAQDFHATFGLGDSPTSISSIDTGGVALAAIKGLKQEKDSQIETLRAESRALAADNAKLLKQLNSQADRVLQLELALSELLRKQSGDQQLGFIE
jgi:hypothetical protein